MMHSEPDWQQIEQSARAWTLDLVGIPSVTNSAAETALAPWLQRQLSEHPYFAAHPGHLRLLRTQGDAWERYALCALVRGSGRQTVVLTGHYDTVSVANYGTLADVAFEPEALRPRLIEELQARGQGAADALALADLLSGEFLPGRAALDMKSGLAAGLAVLEAFAEMPMPEGNLLFLAVPDEEEGSHGMRSAAPALADLAAEWGLELTAAVNLDAEVDSGDGEQGRAIFLGSVGKLLPSVLLVGRPTHAGAPFDGLSASLLAAELMRAVELNPDLADPGFGEQVGPPPVALQSYDLKTHYDVTTPAMLWCAFNVLTREWSPSEVLTRFVEVSRNAVQSAVETARERAERFVRQGGSAARVDALPRVLTYAELRQQARARGGEAALEYLDRLARDLAADPALDTPRVCQRLVEATVREAGLEGPAAVVSFASLYYPPANLPDTPGGRLLRRAAERVAAELSGQDGVGLTLRPSFPGVSDMSFLGACPDLAGLSVMRENTPAWGSRLQFDYEGAARRAVPTVNAGPWGRDYHQRGERVHAGYAFGTLPRVLWRLARELLAPEA